MKHQLLTLNLSLKIVCRDNIWSRVYWTNDSKSIMSGDLNRTEIVSFMTTVYNPTQITAYGDQVIWLETDGYVVFNVFYLFNINIYVHNVNVIYV